MSKKLARPPMSCPLKVDEIGNDMHGEIDAMQAEREAIAALLDLPVLEGLCLDYRLLRVGAGRLRLTGTLRAKVTQTCVVTLEPVKTKLEVPVEAEFWPSAETEDLQLKSEDNARLDWPEPIEDGAIDLGPLIYETLAMALDPYPKREGASFEWSENVVATGAASEAGPFAALKQLKER